MAEIIYRAFILRINKAADYPCQRQGYDGKKKSNSYYYQIVHLITRIDFNKIGICKMQRVDDGGCQESVKNLIMEGGCHQPDSAQSCNGRGEKPTHQIHSGLPWQSPHENVFKKVN
jgi:hypothetical protein